MLARRDFRVYPGLDRNEVCLQFCDYWARQGFHVVQVSPFHIKGRSFEPTFGLNREFTLYLGDANGGTHVDLQFQASATTLGLVGGVAATVIFWPVAVIGGAWSYKEYADDARDCMWGFWAYADQLARMGGAPAPPRPANGPPPGTVACDSCGAPVVREWKACPFCGRTREQ